jgi:hypothetical protein
MMTELDESTPSEPWESHVRAIICPPGEGSAIDNPLGGPLTFEVRGD